MNKFSFKRYFTLIAGLLYASCLFAQNSPTQTVRGTVKDKDTHVTLPGVSVCLMHDSVQVKCTVTDTDGSFKMTNVPVGRYDLFVFFTGYKSYSEQDISVLSGRQCIQHIQLEQSVVGLKTVEVKAGQKGRVLNQMATVSSRSFTVAETDRYAGSRGDPARMASNFAGVRGADDSRNDIIIRGNSPLGLLWRLDGVPIPNPNHFALFGTTGGPVSILNNQTLANSDFLTGAFPAEYGNALAGVFDLRMRSGNNEKSEYTGQFGFLGLEGMAEGPFTSKHTSSYLVTYRYSTLDLFKKAGIKFGVSAVPQYQDVSFKLHFPQKKGVFDIWGLGGKSDIALLDSQRDTTDWSFGDAGKDVFFGSRMGVVGANYFHVINDKTWYRIDLSGSGNESYSIQNIMHDTVNFSLLTTPIPYFRNKSAEYDGIAQLTLHRKINVHHFLQAGVMLDDIMLDLSDSTYDRNLHHLILTTGLNNNTYLLQAYLEWKYKITDDLVANTGVHYQQFLYNNSYAVEPRAGISWSFSPLQSIAFAYGLHHQLQPIYIYFEKVYDTSGVYGQFNSSLDFTQSQHFVLSWQYSISEYLHLKTEAYYQALTHVPVHAQFASSFSMLNEGTDFRYIRPGGVLKNTGTGTNYGLDITLEKHYHRHYYFMLTASFFNSTYKGSDGVKRNTNFNGHYTLNLLGGKGFKLGKESHLSLGMKATWTGGNRYTPFDTAHSNFFNIAYVDSLAYSGQLKDYFRLDLKIGFVKNTKHFTHEISLDLINVTNHNNILDRTYNPFTKKAVDEKQLGFLPVFYYRITF